MITFPNAKINLGLNIVSKRADGYHNIQTCFYPIPWRDVLEIVQAEELSFTTSGLAIPGKADSNLCLKAYQLLNEDYDLNPVHIHLHKVIPMGAGLGGGSADGAFSLKMLNEMFSLNLSDEELENYASQLGSDCPFFIKNQPVLASGTGTTFEDTNLSLKGKHIALIHPEVHVSTAEAYAGVTPAEPVKSIADILELPISYWRDALFNDFEKSVFKAHPSVAQAKEDLYRAGAEYAAMSGSGSCVFGIFEEKPTDVGGFVAEL